MNPGEGYRLLTPDELVIAGDQFFSSGADCWKPSYLRSGSRQSNGLSYRRKVASPASGEGSEIDDPNRWILLPGQRIEPGEGHRLLAVGEMLAEGDEVYTVNHTWEKTRCAGFPSTGVYRRTVAYVPLTNPPGEQSATPNLDKADRKWMLKLAHVQLRNRYRHRPLWGFIKDIAGVGGATAYEIARECGWDPEQPGDKPLTTVL